MTPINSGRIPDVPGTVDWSLLEIAAIPLLILYIVVVFMVSTGFYQILTNFNDKAQRELSGLAEARAADFEGVTILRPLKGVDSEMEWCLEASFKQAYPREKLEIIFCVQSEGDPSIPIVMKLIAKYPDVDAKLLVDADQQHHDYFGPNPKVNNLHKGYKAAKYDLLWVLDSNVFTPADVLKRSVYTLRNGLNNGSSLTTLFDPKKRVKLVTHVPIVMSHSMDSINWGAKLDEMFMSTSHAKFYVALNRIQPAPCVNGKSNLYRRSDLDQAVMNITGEGSRGSPGDGLKHFAKYIGEDNMIGIALWDGVGGCAGMSKDMVFQPIGGQNSVRDYMDRRIRWLRVRKYMVLAATLIEPTTESFMSGIIGSFAINVTFRGGKHIWWTWLFVHMLLWYIIDFVQFRAIHRHSERLSVWCETLRPSASYPGREVYSPLEFTKFWMLRETLAFPIWVLAMAGSGIEWRGQQFKILSDLTAERL
jgi:ceramide glucosyltransferase